jgi:hypothetical protein
MMKKFGENKSAKVMALLVPLRNGLKITMRNYLKMSWKSMT